MNVLGHLRPPVAALALTATLLVGCVAPEGSRPPSGSAGSSFDALPAASGLAPAIPAPGVPEWRGDSAVPLAPPVPSLEPPRFVPDELLVSLNAGVETRTFLKQPDLDGFRLLDELALGARRVLHLRLPETRSLTSAREQLSRLPGVAYVELNLLSRPALVPNDPMYGDQWAHQPQFGDTEGAWDLLGDAPASKVIVAVIDTGIDGLHEEFQADPGASRVYGGRNVSTQRAGQAVDPDIWAQNLFDESGHGTLVAGIIGAAGNNGKGVAGVSWGCRIMPIKAANYNELGEFDFKLFDIIRGIVWALNYDDTVYGARVRVINLSLGANLGRVSPIYQDAVNLARRKGVLVIAASGNFGAPVVGAPANTPGVIAVGATAQHVNTEFVAHYSNYGPRLDLVAPGSSIRVVLPGHESQVGTRGGVSLTNYGFASGTSEAAPYVAGVAALVFAKYDRDNTSLGSLGSAIEMVDQVRTHLLMSVDDFGTPGWDPSWGYGRINARKALSEATLRPFDTRLGRKPVVY
ncbi:MAG: S8 family serine peptidase [Candidatus Sericytochromatia bacterium]|nr:S8 family serine peptidase [Candidatus Sericytochromatia bacterium]